MTNRSVINYSTFAKQKRELVHYDIKINDLNTFYSVIEDTPHTFTCDFFFFEEKKHTCIKYSIKAILKLICQNSLEIFDYEFNVSNTIILVEDDRHAENSQFEPFICHEAVVDLREIIKEEILLDLPLVPKKDSYTCKNTKKHSYYVEQENVIEEKKNPFEILKKLK
ncbi:DUF177 domain-containing protein [Francisellaceae bacterium CB299]|jgi:uncharacterized protein